MGRHTGLTVAAGREASLEARREEVLERQSRGPLRAGRWPVDGGNFERTRVRHLCSDAVTAVTIDTLPLLRLPQLPRML